MKHRRKSKHIRQKKQEKRFTQWFAGGSTAFILLAIGAFLFWHSNQTPQEPVKVYKTTLWSPQTLRQSIPSEGQQKGGTSHIPPSEGGSGAARENAEPEMLADTSVETTLVDETTPAANRDLTDSEISKLEHAALHMTVERVMKEFETILTEMNERYPEVNEVMSISHEELHKRYPTQASRDALNERLDQMRAEFKDRAIQLFSELPTETQLEYIIRIDEQISKTHGDEAANEMTAELLDKLKL